MEGNEGRETDSRRPHLMSIALLDEIRRKRRRKSDVVNGEGNMMSNSARAEFLIESVGDIFGRGAYCV